MNDTTLSRSSLSYVPRDLTAGLVVFLVALPLCLGIALASGAPLFSGLVSGIIGGIVVGWLSGSRTSVSGPAAALTAIIATQIATLGSLEALLLAIMLAGVIQIALGIAHAGALSAFFPSSVIKGLLAAIGVILILKQIPHVLGHDTDPQGEMSFSQPDAHNTLTEFETLFAGEIHVGAAVIGIASILLLVFWDRIKPLKNSIVPGPLVVVVVGVLLQLGFQQLGSPWAVGTSHLVQIPVADTVGELVGFLRFPDFTQWANPAIYVAGTTIAIVASLATLMNLEAVDNLDPEKRKSPPSRELVAQGIGNVISGAIGGLPITSVIVRGSVNVGMGAKTKLSAVSHGVLLLICVGFLPGYLNMIPLASLGAILLVIGCKLASPKLIRQMWDEGRYQFIPFITTLSAIVLTDLLIGILVGLAVSVLFILNSNLRQPIRRIVETHLDGDILHIELANQVSFLNRAALAALFDQLKPGTNLLIDASESDFIDPDVLSLVRDFKNDIAPARGIKVNLRGFRNTYQPLYDQIQYADYSTRELQNKVTPQQVLDILREGNRRFRTGNGLSRDFRRQVNATAQGQSPLAVMLSCIDSRVPVELVFDLGLGDAFSVRVAGNVVGSQLLASIEYGVTVAGVKLVLVLGHTRCGAVTSAVDLLGSGQDIEQTTGCPHLHSIVDQISHSVSADERARLHEMPEEAKEQFIDQVAQRNVLRTIQAILDESPAICAAHDAGKILVVGGVYDVRSGGITFLTDGVRGTDNVVES